MFSGCISLIEAPKIPNSVVSCSDMFHFCKSITKAPVLPAGPLLYKDMCADTPLLFQDGCKWNLEHRTFDYNEHLDCCKKRLPADIAARFEDYDNNRDFIVNTVEAIELYDSHTDDRAYKQIFDGILSGIYTDSESIRNELDIVHKLRQRAGKESVKSFSNHIEQCHEQGHGLSL